MFFGCRSKISSKLYINRIIHLNHSDDLFLWPSIIHKQPPQNLAYSTGASVFFTADIWWSLIRWLCCICNWTCWNTCFPDTQATTLSKFSSHFPGHFSVLFLVLLITLASSHLDWLPWTQSPNLFSRFSPAMISASLYEIVYILMIPTFPSLVENSVLNSWHS